MSRSGSRGRGSGGDSIGEPGLKAVVAQLLALGAGFFGQPFFFGDFGQSAIAFGLIGLAIVVDMLSVFQLCDFFGFDLDAGQNAVKLLRLADVDTDIFQLPTQAFGVLFAFEQRQEMLDSRFVIINQSAVGQSLGIHRVEAESGEPVTQFREFRPLIAVGLFDARVLQKIAGLFDGRHPFSFDVRLLDSNVHLFNLL